MAGEGRINGSVNRPRERMLRLIEEQWPEFDPVSRMIELAEMGRTDMLERHAEYVHFRDTGKMPEVPPHADNDGAGLEQVRPPQRITAGEINTITGMYERAAKFLVPQLKAAEVKIGGFGEGGDVVVRFKRSGDD